MKINRQQLLEDYEDEELVDSIIADATEGINEKMILVKENVVIKDYEKLLFHLHNVKSNSKYLYQTQLTNKVIELENNIKQKQYDNLDNLINEINLLIESK